MCNGSRAVKQEKLKIIGVDAVTLPKKFYFAVQIYSILVMYLLYESGLTALHIGGRQL